MISFHFFFYHLFLIALYVPSLVEVFMVINKKYISWKTKIVINIVTLVVCQRFFFFFLNFQRNMKGISLVWSQSIKTPIINILMEVIMSLNFFF